MKPAEDLRRRVARTIARHAMLAPGRRVGIAVSGGADSVCLLHLLHDLASDYAWSLTVLHLDHRLRGDESRQDAEFVRALAGSLGLPFILEEADVARMRDNVEQAARETRLALFRRVIADGHVDRVATGHTASDQAETVLFRFLRGAGSAGLAGVRPVTSDGLVRPLVEIQRFEVEQYLMDRGISWRNDSTNASLEFARNRIRHGLLPQLAREWNPGIVETLAHTAEWAAAEETWWEAEIGRLADQCFTEDDGAVILSVSALREFPDAIARRLVRRAMEKVKGDLRGIDFKHILAVQEMAAGAEGHARTQAPGLDILRSFDWLRFDRPERYALETRNYRIAAPVPGEIRMPAAGVNIALELIEIPGTSVLSEPVYNGGMACLDWCRVTGPLELRNWRPGDQYQPMGTTEEVKIKALFQEGRIPLWERRHWPILLDGERIIWARRFGPAATFASGPSSRVLLKITDAADCDKTESGQDGRTSNQ